MRASSILLFLAAFATVPHPTFGQTPDPQMAALQAEIATGKHDDITGHYQSGAWTIISVTREGKQLFAQVGENSPFMELTPVSGGGYTTANGRAQVTFPKDGAGKVTSLILKQGNNEQTALRLTDVQATTLKDALAKRIAANQPAPGVEEILRKHIEGMRVGKPIYDSMTQAVAAAVKPQEEYGKTRLAQVGAIRKIEFRGVAPNGLDTFHVQFENGDSEYLIGLNTDGKISSLGVRPGQ
jgi:hypothetical protein